MKLSIVTAAHNEEKTVGGLVEKALSLHPGSEFIVVDDCSSDNTTDVSKNAGAKVISLRRNVGQSMSLQIGIESSKHDVVVIMDSDGEHPAENISDLVRIVERGCDFAKACRTHIPRLSEKVVEKYFMLRFGIGDPMNQFRAFPRYVYDRIGHYDCMGCYGGEFVANVSDNNFHYMELKIDGPKRDGEPRIGNIYKVSLNHYRALYGLIKIYGFRKH